jgi:hypothetical protein
MESGKIINAIAGSASVTSTEFRCNNNGCFTLDIATTGTLVGTFKLQHKVNPAGTAKDITTYTWPNGPAGSAWTYVEEFSGATKGTRYYLVFTRVSGTGDIVACLDNLN